VVLERAAIGVEGGSLGVVEELEVVAVFDVQFARTTVRPVAPPIRKVRRESRFGFMIATLLLL
jgi:hypothetical protein